MVYLLFGNVSLDSHEAFLAGIFGGDGFLGIQCQFFAVSTYMLIL